MKDLSNTDSLFFAKFLLEKRFVSKNCKLLVKQGLFKNITKFF